MARAAAEDIQNRVSISFFLFVFGCCLCYHRENRAQCAPKQEGAVMEKIKLEIAGIPAVLYGKRSRRVYLYVHGKNGSAAEAARFARTACLAGWQVLLSICRSTAPGKTARKSWCRGWSPGSCRRFTPGCSRYGSISGCMGSASGRGLLCRRCRRKNRRRRCWCPRSWIWKN